MEASRQPHPRARARAGRAAPTIISLDTGRVLLRGTSLRRSAGGMAVQGRVGGRPTAARGRKAQLRVCTFANRSVGASLIRPWLAHAPTALQEATFLLSSKGIRVLIDQDKTLQVKAFLQAELFDEYRYTAEEEQSFNINLLLLLECLNIFGGGFTSMRLTYAGYGNPLTLMLEESGVITDCNIRTMEPNEPGDIDIRATEVRPHWRRVCPPGRPALRFLYTRQPRRRPERFIRCTNRRAAVPSRARARFCSRATLRRRVGAFVCLYTQPGTRARASCATRACMPQCRRRAHHARRCRPGCPAACRSRATLS